MVVQHEPVQYKPPVPSVFGSTTPDLPTFSGTKKESSMHREHMKTRPPLQDRIALYEDDNPRCQNMLCIGGIFFFPLWLLGAILYVRTPEIKALSRRAGMRNVVMSAISVIVMLGVAASQMMWRARQEDMSHLP
mmetsp:Transcript_44428/g.96583  ORF Transcript_44428/g.96583 Transcript_44428/m.96583 type:complete len:134 (-) Transcript_44428:174-575(-)